MNRRYTRRAVKSRLREAAQNLWARLPELSWQTLGLLARPLGWDAKMKPVTISSPPIDDATRFPLRAEPERPAASRPCAVGAAQLRHGARARRAVAAAHGGHRRARCRPEFEAAITEDLAWLGLEWEKPVRRQSAHFDDYQSRAGDAGCAAADLPGVREPRRSGAHGRRPRRARALAARSRRRAGLSRRGAADAGGGPAGAHRRGRSLCRPPRHGEGDGLDRAAALDRDRRGAVRRDRRDQGRSRGLGRRDRRPQGDADQLSSRRSCSTTRSRASPMWCAARTCSGRPACTGCCNRCSISRRRSITTTG